MDSDSVSHYDNHEEDSSFQKENPTRLSTGPRANSSSRHRVSRSTSTRRPWKPPNSRAQADTNYTLMSNKRSKQLSSKSSQIISSSSLVKKVKGALDSIIALDPQSRQLLLDRFLTFAEHPSEQSQKKFFEDLNKLASLSQNDIPNCNSEKSKDELVKRIEGYIKKSQQEFAKAKALRIQAEVAKKQQKETRYKSFLDQLENRRRQMKLASGPQAKDAKQEDFLAGRSMNKSAVFPRRCNSVCHRYRSLLRKAPNVLNQIIHEYECDPCLEKRNRSVSVRRHPERLNFLDQQMKHEEDIHLTAPFLETHLIHKLNLNKPNGQSIDKFENNCKDDRFAAHYNFDRRKPMYLNPKMHHIIHDKKLSGPVLSLHFLKQKLESQKQIEQAKALEEQKAKSTVKKPVSESVNQMVKLNFNRIIQERRDQQEKEKVSRFQKDIMLKFIDFQAKDALKKCKKRPFVPANEFTATVDMPAATFEKTSSDFIAPTKASGFNTKNQKIESEVGRIARPKSAKSKVRSFKYKWIDLNPKANKKPEKMKNRHAKSVPIVRKNIERLVLMDLPQKVMPKNLTTKSKTKHSKADAQAIQTTKSMRKTVDIRKKMETVYGELYSEKKRRQVSTAIKKRQVVSRKAEAEFGSRQFSKTRKMAKPNVAIIRAEPKVDRKEKAVIEEYLADLPKDEGIERTSTNVTLISMDQLFTMPADKILQIPYLKVI